MTQRYSEIKDKLVSSIPRIMKNLIIAVLIWLFGILVFIPLGSGITIAYGISVERVISLIIFVALVFIFLDIVKYVLLITDSLASFALIYFFQGNIDPLKEKEYVRGFKKFAYVLVALVAYMFLLPFLTGIFKAFAGLALVGLLIWTILIFYQIGHIFSDKIEDYAEKASRKAFEKIEEREKKAGKG